MVQGQRHLMHGVPVSPGYAIGPVGILRRELREVVERKIPEERISAEIALFGKGRGRALRELQILRNQLSKHLGEHDARIFETHAQILQGPEISEGIPRMIEEQLVSAETAAYRVMRQIEKLFEETSPGVRDKAIDISDVAERLLSHLDEEHRALEGPSFSEPTILIAYNITPSLLTGASPGTVVGLATETGGTASHVAILARSLQIPAVSGMKQVALSVQKGDFAILDGVDGVLIVNPTPEELEIYEARRQKWESRQKELLQSAAVTEPITFDGRYFSLLANIESPEESGKAMEAGCEGIGLFRSEFLFFGKSIPTEEEQFQAYRHVLESLYPREVTIRTLDAGGDKVLKNLSLTDEANPVMGWRSIRFCLDNREIFREQLRALLRASVYGRLQIMFPMISALDELLLVKEELREVRASLARAGIPMADEIAVGTMIEVPSAVMQIADIVKEVDFVSIGSNDLIQFALAVDRSNEKVKDLFQPHHPAVLSMIKMVCEAAHREDVPVTCCGEMASDALSMIVLTGLGVDALSMSPFRIVGNKNFLRSISYEEMLNVTEECLRCKSASEIDQLLYTRFAKRVAEAGAVSNLLSERRFQEKAMVRYGDNFVGLSFAEN